jgi:hypothetical protein
MKINAIFLTLSLLATLLGGCTGTPPSTPANSIAQPTMENKRSPPTTKHYSKVISGLYVVDFDVDTRYSKIVKDSCYSFLSGTVTNNSSYDLSRQWAVEFDVYHGDRLLFHDYTFLRTDLNAGSRVQFDLLESPSYKKPCPSFDRIDVTLRKIVQNDPTNP